jgi:transposase
MMTNKAFNGSGNLLTGPMCGRRRGEKETGPKPTDRAKPGIKDHILTDERGVPLSVVVTAANVNEGPTLPELVNNYAVVRPRPSKEHPQHICLDAAFDNEPARRVVMEENYQGHIAPRKGREEDKPWHPGGKARRWVVERTHAWHDRFRRLVVNWEKTIESRYAFLCLANALIAYRI